MCVATVIIPLVVLILSVALFHAEQNVQSGSFEQLIVTLQWAYMWCLDNPYNNTVYEPLTCVGRLLIIALAIVKIAIVAVPAGLLTEGFLTAVGEEKRARELNEYYERIKKSFRRDIPYHPVCRDLLDGNLHELEDLSGRLVFDMNRKGIYIVNGKKVLK